MKEKKNNLAFTVANTAGFSTQYLFLPFFLINKILTLLRVVKKQCFQASLAAKVGQLTFPAWDIRSAICRKGCSENLLRS